MAKNKELAKYQKFQGKNWSKNGEKQKMLKNVAKQKTAKNAESLVKNDQN